jgi:CRISPR-associated protein Csm4
MVNSRLFKFDFDRVHFGDAGLESSTIGCAADTLYSALCITALRMGGQDLLDELAAAATLRLSDLMPYVGECYLVAKPLHAVQTENSSVQKKAAKKVGFVPVDQLGDFLAGRADLEELAALQARIGVHAVAAKASIHNGGDDAEPYRVGYFKFADHAGLWLLATGSDPELKLLTTVFDGMGALGGERTAGYGTFTLTEATPPPELTASSVEGSVMTLTTALPADDELDAVLTGATYRLVKRSGFIASSSYAETPRRRRDLYKLAAGSVFTRPFDGVIADVGGGGTHPVYSYARPLFLALPETAT